MAPPGLVFVGKALIWLLVLLALVHLARHTALSSKYSAHVPGILATSLLFLACVPICVAGRVWTDYFLLCFEAASMGARPVPVVKGKRFGNFDILQLIMDNWLYGYPDDGFGELCEQYGMTYNLYVLWENIIFTCDPEYIKILLCSDFANYEKGPNFSNAAASVLGTGVFNSDADMWKFHRSMTRPFFSRDRISHFDIFDHHADVAIGLMKKRLSEGIPVDFQDVASRFTLDSATEFLFGKCVNSLSALLPYPHTHVSPEASHAKSSSNDFAVAFAEALGALAARLRAGSPWPLMELFRDSTRAPMKVVNGYLDPIVKDALEKHNVLKDMPGYADGAKEEVGEDDTLLDHLVKYTSDPAILRDEILNIMIAGRDTTASTLTFAVYFLAIHPDVLARLRAEILDKVGPSRRPTYDDIRDLKYLRAVINETLRLLPAVPFNVRDSIKASTWPSRTSGEKPIHIPARTNVTYSVFMMHRRTDLWGPDALEFDPDRFLDDRLHKYLVPNPFIFLPFNAGPRICLGQQFAYNEISFMVVRLLQNFDAISLAPGAQPAGTRPPASWKSAQGRKAIEQVYPKTHLTMYANGGLWVTMKGTESAS